MSAAKKQSDRSSNIAMIHLGTANLFGREDEAAHRDYLFKHTGKTSCSKLTDLELDYVVKVLRKEGALDNDGNKVGGTGPERPTKDQWRMLGALSRRMGWQGLEDERTQSFICKTAKVTNSRFLTRELATKVITGLERWLSQMAEKQGA